MPIAIIYNTSFIEDKYYFAVKIIDKDKTIDLDKLKAVLYKNGTVNEKLSLKDNTTNLVFDELSKTDGYEIKIEGFYDTGENQFFSINKSKDLLTLYTPNSSP